MFDYIIEDTQHPFMITDDTISKIINTNIYGN